MHLHQLMTLEALKNINISHVSLIKKALSQFLSICDNAGFVPFHNKTRVILIQFFLYSVLLAILIFEIHVRALSRRCCMFSFKLTVFVSKNKKPYYSYRQWFILMISFIKIVIWILQQFLNWSFSSVHLLNDNYFYCETRALGNL